MAFGDLFQLYPNKNAEVLAVAKKAYEYGSHIAQEPSAAASMGLDEHALKRQADYVLATEAMIDAFFERPIPDLPAVHPNQLPIDLSVEYSQFALDGEPLNEDTELLANYWMSLAVTLAKSQSASLAGSLLQPDYNRAKNILAVIAQYLTEVANRVVPDVPETAAPGATLMKGKKAK